MPGWQNLANASALRADVRKDVQVQTHLFLSLEERKTRPKKKESVENPAPGVNGEKMGDPRGAIKAARKQALKEGGAQAAEAKATKKPFEAKPTRPKAIVRVAATDLDGNKSVPIALIRIRGVGYNFAWAVCQAAGIDPKRKLIELSEEEIKKVESVIQNPAKFGLPAWILNRQKDLTSGETVHLTGPDLVMSWRSDIEQMRKIHSWKGLRHEMGLPVRGQHTRTAGRKGLRVGVVRKKLMPGAKPAEKKEEKK